MKERRRSERLRCELPVVLSGKRGSVVQLVTADVSRHGVFIVTDSPKPQRELVQLAIELPERGAVDVIAMVARHLTREGADASARQPGMGVDFFALSRQDKDRWDRFVFELSRLPPSAVHPSVAPVAPLAAQPPAMASAVQPSARAAEPGSDVRGQPPRPAPTRRTRSRHRSCFLVRLKDRARMRDFYTHDISSGGMFFRSPAPQSVGPEVELIIVHPETGEEFPLLARVARVVDSADMKERGVALAIEQLTPRAEQKLLAFIETGVNYLDRTGDHETIDLLARAIEIENASPMPLVALGQALLREVETDQALAVFLRALALDANCLAAHRGLVKAYTMLGDAERAAEHQAVVTRLPRNVN